MAPSIVSKSASEEKYRKHQTNHDTFKWRMWTRLVAVVDIVCTTVCLLFLLAAAVFLFLSLQEKISHTHQPGMIKRIKGEGQAGFIYWIFLPGSLLGIQMWAACKLLMSTNMDASPLTSYMRAELWRNCIVIFFILVIYLAILYNLPIWLVSVAIAALMWRGIAFYAVSKYMNELDVIRKGKHDETVQYKY